MTTQQIKKPVSEMTPAEYSTHIRDLVRWAQKNLHLFPTDLLIDSAELAPPPDSVDEQFQEVTLLFDFLDDFVDAGIKSAFLMVALQPTDSFFDLLPLSVYSDDERVGG